MTDAMIVEIRTQMYWSYVANPSVVLSRVGQLPTETLLATMTDTRMAAGTYSSSTTQFPDETVTPEPTIVYVNHTKINQTIQSAPQPTDTDGVSYPIFYNTAGNIQCMSLQDMHDTFAYDTINSLVSGAPIYMISNSGDVNGYQLLSSYSVFTDTRADTGLYIAARIPMATDAPMSVNNYYLHKRFSSPATYTVPAFANSSGNLLGQVTNFHTLLGSIIRNMAASVPGYRIRYNINGPGYNCGTGMTDTRLNGSGNYQTRYVSANDYRAQEFPNGTPTDISVYYLRTTKE